MTTKIISKEEALKKVAEVLEEALAEYESLEKMDLETAEDPSRPSMDASASESSDEDEEKKKKKEDDSEDSESDESQDEEENEEEGDEDEEKKKKDEDLSDDTLKSEYAALEKKMKERGLIKTEAPKAEEMKKSETPAIETLQKSIDDRFEHFAKAISSIQETVQKIAGQPAAPRKGVSGYQPLKKTEEAQTQSLRKSEIVDKLLDLKKSDRRINTALINRVETNRLTKSDLDFINSILA